MSARSLRALLLLTVAATCWASPVAAKVSRCVGPDGTVTYTDKGCANGRTQAPTGSSEEVEAPPAPAPTISAIPPPTPAPRVEASAEAPAAAPPAPAPVENAAPTPTQSAAPAETASAEADETSAAGDFRQGKRVPAIYQKLFLLGIALFFLAWIWMVVAGFRESAVWGIVILLFSPLTMILFTLFHFQKGKLPMLMAVVAAAIGYGFFVNPAEQIGVRDSYVTTRSELEVGIKEPRSTFAGSETVNMKTVVEWGDVELTAVHIVMWLWYTDGKLVANHALPLPFTEQPFVLLGSQPAAALGEGPHRVEVYVDGVLMDTRRFDTTS